MWILPTENDVLTVLSETELATYRAAAPTVAQVVDLVRGYIGAHAANTLGLPGSIPQKLLAPALDLVAVRLPQRVGVPPKEVRKAAADQAVRLLEQVASGSFSVEEPDEASDETTSVGRPSIAAHRRRFGRREEEGV